MREYVERVGTDEVQFQVAASKQGVMLYGNITTNVAESFNKDAKALRAANSEFAIVEGLVHLCFSRFENARDNYKKYCTPTGKRTTGSPLTPYIERSISTLERKGYGYVVKALSSNTFSVKSYSEGATTNIVNLNDTDSSWNAKLKAPGGVDFAKLCCGRCAMTHFPCAKVICALGQLDETAGIRSTVKSWLDLGDTLSQWSKQWQPFLQGHAAFQLPQRLNDVPVPMLSQGVKLEQASLTNTTIASPPLLPMPACRPKGTATTGLNIWGQPKLKRIKTEAGCPGRSGLPRVQSFVYEAQVGLLCAKHAINNLFAIKDFVTLDLLDNNIVPTAKPQGRKDGFPSDVGKHNFPSDVGKLGPRGRHPGGSASSCEGGSPPESSSSSSTSCEGGNVVLRFASPSPSPSCASWRGLGSIGLASGVVPVGLASGVPDRDERNGLAGLRDMARIVRYVTGTLESRFTGRILLLVQC
eukprot:COSAG05_NODE_3015_length_2414_cov_75.142549_1_plen_470_part_00